MPRAASSHLRWPSLVKCRQLVAEGMREAEPGTLAVARNNNVLHTCYALRYCKPPCQDVFLEILAAVALNFKKLHRDIWPPQPPSGMMHACDFP